MPGARTMHRSVWMSSGSARMSHASASASSPRNRSSASSVIRIVAVSRSSEATIRPPADSGVDEDVGGLQDDMDVSPGFDLGKLDRPVLDRLLVGDAPRCLVGDIRRQPRVIDPLRRELEAVALDPDPLLTLDEDMGDRLVPGQLRRAEPVGTVVAATVPNVKIQLDHVALLWACGRRRKTPVLVMTVGALQPNK